MDGTKSRDRWSTWLHRTAGALFGAMVVAGTVLLAASSTMALEPAAAIGRWNLAIDADGREMRPVLEISMDDSGILAGVWRGAEGDTELRDVRIDSDLLSFTFERPAAGDAVTLRFRGRIDGDRMQGELVLPHQTVTVEGSREPESEP